MPIIDGTSQAIVGKLGVFVGMDYVGKIEFTFNKTIPAGKIPAFGLEYSRTTYNKLWEEVQKHPEWKLTEEAWQEFYNTHNGQVPFYSDGDGNTTFRVPRLTGFAEGAGSLEEVGSVKEAGLPEIVGRIRVYSSSGDPPMSVPIENNAFSLYGAATSGNLGSSSVGQNTVLDFRASDSNSIYSNSNTVQPPAIVGMWVITAFVAVTGISSTALDNIASGLTEAETRIGELENSFAIIYPNGGTIDEPAIVETNNRYIEENPFKGYYVKCEAQIFVDEKWGVAGWIYSAGGWGTCANQLLPDDTIIVLTGSKNILAIGSQHETDTPHTNTGYPNSAPCRVLVQKLGKIGE